LKNLILVSKSTPLINKTKKVCADLQIGYQEENDPDNLIENVVISQFNIIILTTEWYKDKPSQLHELIRKISQIYSPVKIILLAEHDDSRLAASTILSGVYQYALMPIGQPELKVLIESALEQQLQIPQMAGPEKQEKITGYGLLAGKSTAMQQVYKQLQKAAASDIPVLLIGETGTGKDLAALTIHQQSDREQLPYLPINLGSLPRDLVASELFGHERGSFTGASKQHLGVFERGSTGTVFLDEIDAIEEKVQISLLRLLEQKKFARLGGKKTIQTDARIIVASNENLEELVRNGNFREDLFYRLDVFRITMPALRNRIEDIPLLTEKFLASFNRVYQKDIKNIEADYMRQLQTWDWPGNVRELKNVLQRSILLCEGNKLQMQHLPARFQKTKEMPHIIPLKIGTPLNEMEKEIIKKTLLLAQDNRTQAARLLGISRRALYNKLKKHDLM
jgi:DNA-binding NtrC family response regulator